MSEDFYSDEQTMPAINEESASWVDNLPDDLRQVAMQKGWQQPADALKSYKHLEEYLGADKSGRGLVLPKNETDQEGYNRLYSALGRPETADGYGLTEALEGQEVDPRFLGSMSSAMHEAGLSKRQAHSLTEAWQSQINQINQAYVAEKTEVEMTCPPARLEAARRGFRFSGTSAEMGEVIEKALGPRAAVELFAKIGTALAEDRPVEGGQPLGGAYSPEAAARRMDRLMSDPAFSKRYLDSDKAAIEEISELARRATANRR